MASPPESDPAELPLSVPVYRYLYQLCGSVKHQQLLRENIWREATALRELLAEADSRNGEECVLFYFYRQKGYGSDVVPQIETIVAALAKISPGGVPFCAEFQSIIASGITGGTWVEIVQAFFHAKFFLEMAVKYATDSQQPAIRLAPGWNALLELYGIR